MSVSRHSLSFRGARVTREPGIQKLTPRVHLDSGFASIGPRFARTRWTRPGMTIYTQGTE